MAIQFICQKYNCELAVLPGDDNITYLDKARDLVHPGVKSHAYLASQFIELIS